VLVAVVVEDRGRDGIRVAGLEGVDWPMLSILTRPFCDGGRSGTGSSGSIGGGESRPFRERERERERVSDRVMKRYSCEEQAIRREIFESVEQRCLLYFPTLISWWAGRRLEPYHRHQHRYLGLSVGEKYQGL